MPGFTRRNPRNNGAKKVLEAIAWTSLLVSLYQGRLQVTIEQGALLEDLCGALWGGGSPSVFCGHAGLCVRLTTAIDPSCGGLA
ncbi:hypothetical protein MPNT_30170 [Candidatus Methylacidithermus pantelleriae]|uniref:Uncharacterized protein n=1 Tax=Candidatus Methylacidithermus pantelleriae TaxID=2744239 RepID=A0A8J2BKA2_9BACT|nr:hypothetical protein MPNT_30170 [Candidatus Methylacidithermus pantelleriae]